MTDLLDEITFCDECPYSGEPNGCDREEGICKAHESYFDLVEENAALKERLDKSVELPSGDRVWFITEDEEGKESYIISKPTDCLTVDELYEIGKKYFTTPEAAKAYLAERKGGNKDE